MSTFRARSRGRWFVLACLILGCAHPATRRTQGGREHRVSGRLFRSEAFCHSPPTHPRPHAGPVRVYRGGRRGYAVPGELVVTVPADEKAGYEVYLSPGSYCLAGGDAPVCDVEVQVTGDVPMEPVDVHYQVGPRAPCEY